MRRWFAPLGALAVVLGLGLALGACDDAGDEEPEAATTGSLEIVGGWVGELPEGARPSVALFDCPFVMPPRKTAGGTIAEDRATVQVTDLAPGEICVMAFLDADHGDGVMPINGLDLVAYPPEGQQSFAVTIASGETTRLDVTYELRGDDPDLPEEEPGAEDVWIHLQVTCATCDTTMPVVFYGYAGEEMGMIPDLFNKFTEDVSFPFAATIRLSGAFQPAALAAGRYIVLAYQDVDGTGMKPGEDEPQSEPLILDLVAGTWNEVTLELN